jgi:hypothetical protein
MLLRIADLAYRSSDGIQQSGASADKILAVCDGSYSFEVYPVMKQFVLVVKQNSGDDAFTVLFLLFIQKSIVTPDCIELLPRH